MLRNSINIQFVIILFWTGMAQADNTYFVLFDRNKISEQQFTNAHVKKILTIKPLLIFSKFRMALIEMPGGRASNSVLRRLEKIEMIESIEPNLSISIDATVNDSLFKYQWGLLNFGQSDNSGNIGLVNNDIDVQSAWRLETGSKDTVVAVIDTGIDYGHPDLIKNLYHNQVEVHGQAGIDDDSNGIVDDVYGADFSSITSSGNPMDQNGHGTHCAGTIGAHANNALGISGINWNVSILSVKFLDTYGNGKLDGAIRAIEYSVKMKAKIINSSWGGSIDSPALRRAMEYVKENNVLFVAAAGNNGQNFSNKPHFPAALPFSNIVSVAAVDNIGKLALYSNYGMSVDIAAPGTGIFSTFLGGGYKYLSGTSMAAPFVSGVAALLYSSEPYLRAEDLKQRILDTGRSTHEMKDKVRSGAIINAKSAILNEIPQMNLEDPANWKQISQNINSQNPYKPNAKEYFTIRVSGAKQISIYFKTFETEKDFDKLEIFDSLGNKHSEISGSHSNSFSLIVNGDTANLLFTSDDSVQFSGFEISSVGWR